MNSLTIASIGLLPIVAVGDKQDLVQLIVQVALMILAYLGGKKSGKQ